MKEEFTNRGFETTLTLDRDKSFFDKTLSSLGLTKKDLNNKTILEVGSGPAYLSEVINNDPEISAEIISLDPKYNLKLLESMERNGKIVLDKKDAEDAVAKIKEQKLQAISGLCENLPFKNDTMDLILSNFSVYYYASEKYRKQFEKMLKEMIRVVRDEGEIRIHPIDREHSALAKKELQTKFQRNSPAELVNDILKNEKDITIDMPEENKKLLIIRKKLVK